MWPRRGQEEELPLLAPDQPLQEREGRGKDGRVKRAEGGGRDGRGREGRR